MEKPQIAVRIPPSLLEKLNSYIEKTGTTKTDVVVSAIAQYIGCTDALPLMKRVTNLEKRFAELEAKFNN
ncbi:hypothetical protein [Planktothrix sp.]|uniref:hypothetical protein n=1 Tax=Planktothrix sp. TaxID=3088171 RepID=UPI0038D50880